MKIEIELTEVEKFARFHQDGFSMTDNSGKTSLSFCTQIPSGIPIIKIYEGKHKGKIFTVTPDDMMNALAAVFFAEPCHVNCDQGDFHKGGKCDKNGCYDPESFKS